MPDVYAIITEVDAATMACCCGSVALTSMTFPTCSTVAVSRTPARRRAETEISAAIRQLYGGMKRVGD
jgi:hypothetical protein